MTTYLRYSLIAGVGFCVSIAGSARAAEFTFQQGVSPGITYSHLATNYDRVTNSPGGTQGGSENIMRVGISDPSSGNQFRAALSFPLTDLVIPAGEHITSVTMRLNLRGDEDSPNGNDGVLGPFELHKVTGTGTMVENQVSWSDRATGTPWATAGGDFDPAALTSIPAFVPSNTGTFVGPAFTFNSTPAFIDAVSTALTSGQPLQMILRSSGEEAQAGNGEGFARWLSDDSGDPASRPLLTVTTGVPEPTSTAMLCVALAGLGARHRRRHG